MRKLLAILAIAAAAPVAAQSFSGTARAVDGDTLSLAGERVRLFGIDAPESMQTCDRGGTAWTCGQDAKALLAMMIDGKDVTCTARERDDYGRIVATCRAGESDLSGVMAREGFAVSLPQFTTAYVDLEARAKQYKLALWGSTFANPADFRRANPNLFAKPKPVVRTAARSAPQRVATANWSFRNCAEARAAGAAPLHRGRSGYGAHMDGDGDGVACEPYRGR